METKYSFWFKQSVILKSCSEDHLLSHRGRSRWNTEQSFTSRCFHMYGCSLFSGKNQRVEWGKTASSLLYKQGNVTHMIVYLDSTSLQTDEGYRTRGLTAGFQNQIRMTFKLCLHSKYHPASPLFPHTSISFYPPLLHDWRLKISCWSWCTLQSNRL